MAEGLGPWFEPGEKADIHLCIFPHLSVFLAIDLRDETPKLRLLYMKEVFDASFFQEVEKSFSQVLREEAAHPFLHLISMPLRVEEILREMGLSAVLHHLQATQEQESGHRVGVMIIAGQALSLSDDQLRDTFRPLFPKSADNEVVEEAILKIDQLVTKEKEAVKELEQRELLQALQEESSHFFTLWENQG